jgi:competence protein ComEC
VSRAGWFAAGAAAAAVAGAPFGWSSVAIGCLAVLAGAIALGAARASAAPAVAAFAIGGGLIAGRIALGSLAPVAPAPPPIGGGPWEARVISVGAPKDGVQMATLSLSAPGEPRVAATLPRYPTVEPGRRVEVAGSLRPPPENDYGDWLRQTGVTATLRASRLVLRPGPLEPGTALEMVRRGSGHALALALPEPSAGLAAGILIGLRDEVDRGLAAAFTTAGVSHIVAISGWNIAIVAASVAALLRRSRRRARSVAIILAVVAYTAFAGASPSVVRAAAMAGVVLMARESGRAGRAASALGLASGLLLTGDPGLVGDAGFQLSVLATAGLLAWATPLRDRLERVTRGRAPAWLLETLALSLAAQLATLPVVLAVFGRLSLVAPLANLIVAPLVPPAMALGGIALVGGWATMLGAPAAVATLLGLPGWAVLTLLIALVEASAAVPWASLELGPPWDRLGALAAALVALALAPGLIGSARRVGRGLGMLRGVPAGPALPRSGARGMSGSDRPKEDPSRSTRRQRDGHPRLARVVALVLAAAVAGIGIAATHRPDGRIRVTVLDVGQGDAILVEGDRGGRLLVDGGPDPDRLLVALDGRLPPWDRRLDLVVLTHPHEDHVGGLPLLLERYRVERLLEPGMRGSGPAYAAWADRLSEQGTPSGRLATGDRLTLDSIRLIVLWPDRGTVPAEPAGEGRDINGVSIVLLGIAGSGRFLLTGDIEDDVDPQLVERGLPRIDVLKIAHHGSRTASSQAFIDAVRPAIAIASVGADNPYGHPAPSTLERFAVAGARVLRTDLDGAVQASFDGRTWSIGVERPWDAAPSSRTPGAAVGSIAGLGRVAITSGLAGRSPAMAPRISASPSLGYHRADDDPRSNLGRIAPALAPATGLAPAPLAGGRRGGGLARGAGGRTRDRRRSTTGRGCRAPPRRRQAAPGDGSGRAPPARRRFRALARPTWASGARPGGRGPPDHAPRR